MKKKIALITIASFVVILAGCKFFGANPAPPSTFESGLFDVVTNIVTVVDHKVVTNFVTVAVPEFKTNEVGVVVLHTNEVTLERYNLIDVTNQHEAYTWTAKPATNELAQSIGGISNLIVPGSGGLIAGILTGIAGMWAKLRTSKKTGQVLAQDIETIREFAKTLPGGQKNDDAITAFLQQHQLEAGVINQVLDILKNNVSNLEAKAAATEIQNALKPS